MGGIAHAAAAARTGLAAQGGDGKRCRSVTEMATDLAARIASARALIFDCDGTLIDTSAAYVKSWGAGFAAQGHHMPADWYLARIGLSGSDLQDAFEAYIDRSFDRAAVAAVMRATFQDNLDALREIEAIAAVARRNHGRIPMAVASGGPRRNVEASLRATGLLPLFDTIVTIDDVAHGKPAPDLYLEAARRLGVRPPDCLAFEDSVEGLDAARIAGMPVIDVAGICALTTPPDAA